ncbi:MAG TPA: ABC transporter substrate-binding protein [Candidatus Binatia bacterium]
MKKILVFLFCAAILPAMNAGAAEPAAKVRRIGFLAEDQSSAADVAILKKFLADAGYIDGKTIIVETGNAGGRIEQIDRAAADLVAKDPDLIVADGVSAGQAARRQVARSDTHTTPIVIASRIETIKATSNMTGATNISPDLGIQRLKLLKEIAPRTSRVAVMWHEVNAIPANYLRQVRKAAESLGVEIDARKVKRSGDFQAAFDTMVANKDNGLILEPQLLFAGRFGEIASLAVKARLPSISGLEEFAAAGGLVSYGLTADEMWRHTVVLIDRIFKQRKPKAGQSAELPSAPPEKFYLTVNTKTAADLGLAVPRELLKRADKIVQ